MPERVLRWELLRGKEEVGMIEEFLWRLSKSMKAISKSNASSKSEHAFFGSPIEATERGMVVHTWRIDCSGKETIGETGSSRKSWEGGESRNDGQERLKWPVARQQLQRKGIP